MFYNVFYRQLFLQVGDYGTLFLFQAVLCARDLALFPGRMTDRYLRVSVAMKDTFQRFTDACSRACTDCGCLCSTTVRSRSVTPEESQPQQPSPVPVPVSASVDPELSREDSNAAERRVLVKSFYWNAMAKRMSLSAFALNITLLRFYSPNRFAFPFNTADMPDAAFERLLIFITIMFFTEWAVSTVVHIVIYRVFAIDSMKVGGRAVVNATARGIAIVLGVHVCMDAMLTLNKVQLLSWS